MLNKILSTLILMGVALTASADTVQISPDSPESYVVQKGDTLWDIAGRFLTEPWRWPEIWKVNPQIENPHLIYPGDVVTLSVEGGAPVLAVERGAEGAVAAAAGAATGRTQKLSPAIRIYDRGEAVPSIPIDAIKQFLTRPLVVGAEEMESWPYIVSSFDQHLVAGAGNRVYVRGMQGKAGERRYSVYRKGPAYRSNSGAKGAVYGSPAGPSGPILGYEAIYVGEAVIEEFGDPATATITQSSREVLNGDRLTPQRTDEVTSDFIPRAPAGPVAGSIISVVDGLLDIGQYQVVVLDIGANQGLEVGNYLGVFQTGKVVNDKVAYLDETTHPFIEYLGTLKATGEKVQLPEEYAAVIMVFRIFQQISYALVMEARGPLRLNDSVRNL
ncbi:MAG: LysM peptidoglycan-binding domain-containing protein [Gammaproteobacteria bacterium]|nr:LysM peptidoglycan-binding domain-containing protein [Gammaproteobacteria bacterium]